MNKKESELAIAIKHVKKSYKSQEVLKDINLNVYKGEIFTLLGENGSGKTTLIKMLSTLLTIDAGTIELLGINVQEHPEQIREIISLNAQSNTLDISFSGYENMMLIASLRNLKNAKAEIEMLIEKLHMQDFIHKKVATYSGGMMRRVDIAMSLIGDPAIIFLDEPTTGIDPKNRLDIWDVINEIRDSGKTIFLTTQYLEEAERLSDHIAFLHDGRIAQYGTPNEIKASTEHYVHIEIQNDDFTRGEALLNAQDIQYRNVQNCIFEIRSEQQQKILKLFTSNDIQIIKVTPTELDLETIFLNVVGKETM